MPTTYAHWRFAKDALAGLPDPLRDAAERFRALYDIGAQGPDVFFHYNCLKSNPVTRYGGELHDTPMRVILERFRGNYQAMDEKEAALAYLLGFLAHFTLDSYCHGYIERKSTAEGPSHDRIESQFDRYLLLADGLNPNKASVTFSLKPTQENARVMANLYGQWDERVMRKSVADQVFYRNAMRDSSAAKRVLLTFAMKLAGAGKYMDMLMGTGEHPLCAAANLRLDKYYANAVTHYAALAQSMRAYLEEGEALDPYFDHDFGPKEGWQRIPLLSAEEEKAHQEGLQS